MLFNLVFFSIIKYYFIKKIALSIYKMLYLCLPTVILQNIGWTSVVHLGKSLNVLMKIPPANVGSIN